MSQRKAPRWLRVFIPSVLIVAWVAAAGFGGPYFGRISEVSDLDLVAFLPESAEATKVNEQAKAFRDSSALPAFVVFEAKNDTALTDETTSQISDIGQSLDDNIKQIDGQVAPPIQSEDGRAAYLIVPLDSDVNLRQAVTDIRAEVDQHLPQTVTYQVGGPAGFSADLNKAFSGIDGLLLGVALAVVLMILLIVYRSPVLPLLVLMTSVFALAAAILLVWNLANAGIVKLNGQVQGILFILVIGAATDYSLLYVSRYREELYKHRDKFKATMHSLRGSIEPIFASGGTVIAGLLCLLASDLASNQALGPVGAIGIIFTIASALTFLPALLYVAGRKAFWPRVPQASPKAKAQHQADLKRGIWSRVGDFVARRPRPIWSTITAVMIVMSLGLIGLRADGVDQGELVLGPSEARDAQAIIDQHFPDGSGSPAQIIAPVAKLDQLVSQLEDDPGVDTVAVIANNSPSGILPLGEAEQAIKDELRQQIGASTPGVDQIVERAYPFADAEPKVVDGRVELQATLNDSPDSEAARETIERLRQRLATIDQSVLVGGVTAIALDTNTASIHDRQIILPMILAAVTIILMLLLRSIIAPILLLLTTVLSFAAALGLSSLLFNHLWGFPGADPAVVLYAFVFLVALGIDYNIFLMTRVREEVKQVGTKRGVIKGLVVTGGVITSAGVVLAATFAALSVIPILFLVQLAFIVAFGVLLDTIIIRSLLVPALIRDIGPIVWWPSRLARSGTKRQQK